MKWLCLLLLVPACMRGCPSQPARQCAIASECDDGETCLRGYCRSEQFAGLDEACRESPGCATAGACTAVIERSFLGASNALECAATLEEDCRASERCKTHGRCARADVHDVGCSVATTAMCTASTRCATHDECELHEHECVRRIGACTRTDPPPAPPEWALPTFLGNDYDLSTLDATTDVGLVEHGLVACRFEGGGFTKSILTIGGACMPGPTLSRHGVATILIPNVRLAPGDFMSIAMQNDPIGRASNSMFARVRYDGTTPFRAGTKGESIECHVVTAEVAHREARTSLVALDAELANAAREQTDPMSPRATSHAIGRARHHAEMAAMWLGWNAPELVQRLERIDAAVAAWSERLDARFAELARTKAAHEVVTKGRSILRTRALVCGDALAARRGTPAEPSACALEIEVENLADKPMGFSGGSDDPGFELDLQWFRSAQRANPIAPWTWRPAEVMPAAVIDVRRGSSPPVTALQLPPGERAILLVAAGREDLELGPGGDDTALLAGRVAFGSYFVLAMP